LGMMFQASTCYLWGRDQEDYSLSLAWAEVL
jgi:hypothetical protein